MKLFINNINRANRYLEAAAPLCFCRLNGLCWEACKAREYCNPERLGLTLVASLEQAIHGDAA